MSADLAGWVPFSTRNGIRRHDLGESHVGSRHRHVEAWSNCEVGPFRCGCPGVGSLTSSRCCQRATQEDTLCDECREWCYSVDEAHNRYRHIDLYGAERQASA